MKTDVHTETLSGTPDLEPAFEALRTYDRGSSRGLLLPIDQAAAVASKNPAQARALEKRLLASLAVTPQAVAREYICGKLALIGTAACVPAVSALLADAALSTAARNVLESISDPAAVKALVVSLKSLHAVNLVGVINSLGTIGAAGIERALASKLRDPDNAIVSAVVAALGEIGSAKSARLLRVLLGHPPSGLEKQVADAARVCADKLVSNGKNHEAKALLLRIPG